MERTPVGYILASQKRGMLYIGVTSMPVGRMVQHRDELIPGCTTRYGIKRLVLIEAGNPMWRDLALDFGLAPLSVPRWQK